MEQIQFLNYIMSICSLLLSAVAVWMVFKIDEKLDNNIQVLQNQISILRDNSESKNGRK